MLKRAFGICSIAASLSMACGSADMATEATNQVNDWKNQLLERITQ